jgi:hypothetical protein
MAWHRGGGCAMLAATSRPRAHATLPTPALAPAAAHSEVPGILNMGIWGAMT